MDHLKTLVKFLFIDKLDSNFHLLGISASDCGRLRRFQNSCERLIYAVYVSNFCVTNNGLAPTYSSELLVTKQSNDLSSNS